MDRAEKEPKSDTVSERGIVNIIYEYSRLKIRKKVQQTYNNLSNKILKIIMNLIIKIF